MPRCSFAALLLVVVACCAATASARDLFVDNLAGDDGANGDSPTSSLEAGPVRSISRALAVAKPGDTINVAKTAQPYREQISLSAANQSGIHIMPLTIVVNGAVLDGSAPVTPEAWEIVRGQLFRFRPPRRLALR